MAVALAAVIAVLIVASVLVPSPSRTRRAWVLGCAVTGLCVPLPVLALGAGRGAVAAGIAGAVALMALATWLARGVDSAGPQRPDDPPPPPPAPPAPWDWSDFDRARDGWSRPRARA